MTIIQHQLLCSDTENDTSGTGIFEQRTGLHSLTKKKENRMDRCILFDIIELSINLTKWGKRFYFTDNTIPFENKDNFVQPCLGNLRVCCSVLVESILKCHSPTWLFAAHLTAWHHVEKDRSSKVKSLALLLASLCWPLTRPVCRPDGDWQ